MLSGKVGTSIASLETAVIALTTTLNIAPSKQFNTATLSYTSKFSYVLAKITGPQIAAQIMNGVNPTGGPWQNNAVLLAGANSGGINPLGPLNVTTISGIITLLAGHYLGELGIPHWGLIRKFIINPFGVGLFAGGVAGGLLDAPSGGRGSTGSTGIGGGFAMANATAGRSVMGFTGAY